jgi:hypothetical protein
MVVAGISQGDANQNKPCPGKKKTLDARVLPLYLKCRCRCTSRQRGDGRVLGSRSVAGGYRGTVLGLLGPGAPSSPGLFPGETRGLRGAGIAPCGAGCAGYVAAMRCNAMRCDSFGNGYKEEGRGKNTEQGKCQPVQKRRRSGPCAWVVHIYPCPRRLPNYFHNSPLPPQPARQGDLHPSRHASSPDAFRSDRTKAYNIFRASRHCTLRCREMQRAGASGEICPAALTVPRLWGLRERGRGVAGVGG